jgi:hypothetical protein
VFVAVSVGVVGCSGVGDLDVDSSLRSAPYSTSSATSTPSLETEVASEAPTAPPPYIEYVEWVQTEVGPSLQIHPTRAGRSVSGNGVDDEAWREVLALAPDGDTPGMRAQFDCHWAFARLVDPEKASWNLEPERPVVTSEEMIAARCNPGFAEE